MKNTKIKKIVSLMIVMVIGLNIPTLNASENDYQQYVDEKASENGIVAQSSEKSIGTSPVEGEGFFDDSQIIVDDNILNIFAYSVFHDGDWYSPFFFQNETGSGIILPFYLEFIGESTTSVAGTEYYTYNFQGDDVFAQIVIHLEGNELIFEIKFQNDSSTTVNTDTYVDFDTCLSATSDPGDGHCYEDFVPLYSQGNKKGIYLNGEIFDVNFYINYLGENAPVFSGAYDWLSSPSVARNQINSLEDELLLDGADSAIIFKWDDVLEPGQSITYAFSIGIGEGVFVPTDKPSVSADDNQQTLEEETLSDQQLLDLFNVSATSADGTDMSTSVSVDQSLVDYSTPGVYSVVFNVTDAGGTASQTANLEVLDTLPVISTDLSTLTIELGETVDNPLQSYGVTASEITTGDLTSIVSVDTTAVDYNTTGTYTLLFSVVDEEGNEANAEAELVIVRPSINITGDLTPSIDVISNLSGNEQVSSNEEETLTNEQLIELFEVVNSDNLEISVDQSAVDYSTPGDYQVVFSDEDGNSFVGTLTIVDILPQLVTSTDSVTIEVGSDLDDILSKITIVATEITEEDLNSNVVVDDSAIDYDTAGTYDLAISVQDQEGNVASLTVSIIIDAPVTEVQEDKDQPVIEEDKDQPMVKEETNSLATTGRTVGKSLLILVCIVFGLLIIKYLINTKAKRK